MTRGQVLARRHLALSDQGQRAAEQIIELADRAEVSRAHLFAVLAGRKSPTLDYLNRLATALDCDPHELVKPPRKPAAKR